MLLGAIEGGIVLSIVAFIDIGRHPPVLLDVTAGVYLGAVVGVIFGGLVGAVIGLAVAIWNIRGRGGLWLGGAMGLAIMIYLFATTNYYDDVIRALALIAVPAGASIGFVYAVLTGRKQPPPSPEPRKSHRLFS